MALPEHRSNNPRFYNDNFFLNLSFYVTVIFLANKKFTKAAKKCVLLFSLMMTTDEPLLMDGHMF